MSPSDVAAGTSGEVAVVIYFDEEGLVERTAILRSTKESLSEAVLDAVSRWRIVPPVRAGRIVKLKVNQEFVFKAEQPAAAAPRLLEQ